MPEVKFGDHTSKHVSEKKNTTTLLAGFVTFSLNGNNCNCKSKVGSFWFFGND